MPLITALLFVGIIFLAIRSEERLFQNSGTLDVRREGDAVVLTWKSPVEAPMAKKFEMAFRDYGADTDKFVLDLHSPGGALAEGGELIRVIERIKRTHRIDTKVGPGRSCFSMCVPVFLQGERRAASANSSFMFHEPSAVDFDTGEVVDQPTFERNFTTKRFVDRYFVRSPMDPTWRDNLVASWSGKDVFKSGRELMDEGSGVVTVLE